MLQLSSLHEARITSLKPYGAYVNPCSTRVSQLVQINPHKAAYPAKDILYLQFGGIPGPDDRLDWSIVPQTFFVDIGMLPAWNLILLASSPRLLSM